ncbi:hypothetical protein ACNKHO_00770 [Shigella flexneri]
MSGLPAPAKREAYNADITYGTDNEYGFDYLRDNMAFSPEARTAYCTMRWWMRSTPS